MRCRVQQKCGKWFRHVVIIVQIDRVGILISAVRKMRSLEDEHLRATAKLPKSVRVMYKSVTVHVL